MAVGWISSAHHGHARVRPAEDAPPGSCAATAAAITAARRASCSADGFIVAAMIQPINPKKHPSQMKVGQGCARTDAMAMRNVRCSFLCGAKP